jgi:hypothetical protein
MGDKTAAEGTMDRSRILDALAGADHLAEIAERVAARLVASGATALRPDHMPLRIPLDGMGVARLVVGARGWTKLNFDQVKPMRFDAAAGLIDLADRFTVEGDDHAAGAGLDGERPVLSAWRKNPSWAATCPDGEALTFLEFHNRADAKGARSRKLILEVQPPGFVPPPKAKAKGRKRSRPVPLFDMASPGYLTERTIEALDEAAKLARRLSAHVTEADGRFDDIVISLARADTGLRIEASSACEGSHGDIDAALFELAAGAVAVICGELRMRLPEQDWHYSAPAGCRTILIERDGQRGGFDREASIPIEIGIRDAIGNERVVAVDFGGARPGGEGLSWLAEAPEAPLFGHRWRATARQGTSITQIRFGKLNPYNWPIAATRLQIVDVTRKAHPREINPLAGALALVRLCGRLAASDRRGGLPHLPTYCHILGDFLGDRFKKIRAVWQSGLFGEISFRDVTAAVADINRHLPLANHRVISKHGINKPLYARDLAGIMGFIARMEAIVADATGKPLFLAYGTLLGCVREKGFIPHDDDVDLGLMFDATGFDDMLEQRRRFIDDLSRFDDLVIDDPYPGRAKVYITLRQRKMKTKLDIFPIWRTPDGTVHAMMERSAIRALKGDWFKDFRRSELYGTPVWIPSETERFLEDRYGPGWVTPDPSNGFGKPPRQKKAATADDAGNDVAPSRTQSGADE